MHAFLFVDSLEILRKTACCWRPFKILYQYSSADLDFQIKKIPKRMFAEVRASNTSEGRETLPRRHR